MHWTKETLGDVSEIISGFAFKSKDFKGIGIPVVKIKNINPPYVNISSAECINEDEFDLTRLRRYELRTNDFIVAMTGATIGKVGRINYAVKSYLNQRVALIKPKPRVDQRFIYYSVISTGFENHIHTHIDSHSVQANISAKSIGKFLINFPPLQEQKAIAEVLSSLDDKIELLQKQNETLEALAQTLFRQWFIEEADDSWEEVELGALVDTFNGISYKSSQLKESDIAMVTLKSFARDGSFRLDGFKEFVGEYKDRHECSDGDILVAHTDVTQGALLIGNAIEVRQPIEYKQLLYSMDLVKVVPKIDSDKYFILYTLKNTHFKHHAVGYSNGSTVLHMSKKAVPEYRLKHPPAILISQFHEKVSAFKAKQRLNEASIVTLKQTRDTLLPKLMSGQVRVKLD